MQRLINKTSVKFMLGFAATVLVVLGVMLVVATTIDEDVLAEECPPGVIC